MAARFRLSSLAMCLIAILWAGPAFAQDSAAKPPPAPVPQKKAPEPRADECGGLPGGNAPINRLARLEGGMSVRNLELTYFGKPLFQFTDDDFAYLEALWPLCSTFDGPTASMVAKRLKALVGDAKAVRQDSLDWIKRVEKESKAMKPGQAGIEKIHDFWQEMLNREFQMTASDMAYVSGVLSKRRDELYAASEHRQRTLISPFDPGPPDVRTLGGGGG